MIAQSYRAFWSLKLLSQGGRTFLFLGLLIQGWFLSPAWAEPQITPPFGTAWGQSEAVVAAALERAHGKIVSQEQAGATAHWLVEGLEQEGLLRVLFTFDSEGLSGVELQYGGADWTTETYQNFIQKVRVELNDRLGEGQEIAHDRGMQGSILQTLLGYTWPGGDHTVSLIYFSAQDRSNLFRMASLHYSRSRRAQP